MIRAASVLLLFLATGAAGFGWNGAAELTLHALFSEGMVLQRDLPCPVWGSAAPGDVVSVSIAGQTKSSKTGADGRWSVTLAPMKAGGPHEMTVEGRQTLKVADILVGEVWLAAGGAPMEFPLKSAPVAATDTDNNPIAMIRYFVVPRRSSLTPERDVQASWRTNRSPTVQDVSAAAYFFSRELQRRLKVPVGILQATADDNYAFMWLSDRYLKATPAVARYTFYQRMTLDYHTTMREVWKGQVRKAEEARKRGEPVPEVPPEPSNTYALSGLYNGMIAPLIPYALRGAVLYQGELDYHTPKPYKALFGGLIRNWRADWGLGDFPVGFVQWHNSGPRIDAQFVTELPTFRDAQADILQIPNTGMVVAIDLGDPMTPNPRNMEEVGRRLVLWAEAKAYGHPEVVYSGPQFDSVQIVGDKIRVKFKNVGGGLQVKGDKLIGFDIASEFRRWVKARATLEGDTVVVWSEDYQWPAAVRYAWADNPECNLYNKEGLPAAPFHTDTW